MKKAVGLVTIGQSPRVDVTGDLAELWRGAFVIKEAGALDNLSQGEIEKLAPENGDTVLVSRLRDGGSARLAEEKIIPLVQEKINILAKEVGAVFLLCTGDFPAMACSVPLFEPDKILRNTVRGILKQGQRLGVIVPAVDQQDDIIARWKRYIDNEVVTDFANPYQNDKAALAAAAERLAGQKVDMIVLDCLGFSQEMKAIVQSVAQKPVIIPRTLVGRIIAEVLE